MSEHEVIIEFKTIGNATQVRAIDTQSGIEIALTVQVATSKFHMMQAAKNKLAYVMKRNSEK